jgi:RNA polymerase sigma factor for flagellar operon FliA
MSFVEAALSNEEDWLWRKFHESKDQSVRNQLVECYLPFARQMAASLFARRPDNDVEFSDYMQYASIGLIEAVDRYEATKGAMFKTFASYRIKGAVLNGLKFATEKRSQYGELNKHTVDRTTSLSSFCAVEYEGDQFIGMVEMAIGLALGYMLDELVEEELRDIAPGDDPYRGQAYQQLCARVERAVNNLEEKERRIIQYHYYHQMNFASLADLYGVSKGRISQLHGQALRRIRSCLQESEAVDRIY